MHKNNPIIAPEKKTTAPIPAPATQKGTPQQATVKSAKPSNIVLMDFTEPPT